MYLEHRLCVPEDRADKLVDAWHTQLGYAGVEKTINDMQARFIIPELGKVVRAVLAGCQLCQAVQKPNWRVRGTWQSVPVQARPGACICKDVVSMTPAKTWDGREVDAALVVVERHSG